MTSRMVVALCLAFTVLLCSGIACAGPPIKLGSQAPQTGALAKHGGEQIKGIQLAVDEFQKKFGVAVELKVYDDESDPQKAVSAVEKLAGVDKVNGIVGGYGSHLVDQHPRRLSATTLPTSLRARSTLNYQPSDTRISFD